MAAGDNINVTLNTLTAYNTFASISAALTANAATADTDALKQPYTFTPTKAESKCLMIVKGTGSAADGNITYSVAAGGTGLAKLAALTGTITKNTTQVITLDGKYKKANGTFYVEFTPAATDKLKTDHALTVAFIELP